MIKKIIVIVLFTLFTVGAWFGYEMLENSKVPRITIEQLKEKMDKQENVFVLDIRSNAQTLIKGAVNIPKNQIEKRLAEIPKDSLIVTVCACSSENTSSEAARILMSNGYKNVAALKGGQNAWKAAKYPVVVLDKPIQ